MTFRPWPTCFFLDKFNRFQLCFMFHTLVLYVFFSFFLFRLFLICFWCSGKLNGSSRGNEWGRIVHWAVRQEGPCAAVQFRRLCHARLELRERERESVDHKLTWPPYLDDKKKEETTTTTTTSRRWVEIKKVQLSVTKMKFFTRRTMRVYARW